jgi:hypothetical protein
MMNPNFRELGELTFKADGSYNLDIESCLNCRYFKSRKEILNVPDEPIEFGFCEYPFMEIDETMGLGMVCDLYQESTSALRN